MNSWKSREQQLLGELTSIPDALACFDYLIEQAAGPGLAYEEALRQDCYLVKGCETRTWVRCAVSEWGTVCLDADSDSMLLRGLLMLLVRLYDGAAAGEIEATLLPKAPILRDCFSKRQLETIEHICSGIMNLSAAYRKEGTYEKSN